MFQLDQCANPKYYSFHEEFHPKNSCSYWKQVVTFVCNHTLDVNGDIQEKPKDTNDNEEVAPDEAPSSGHVVNAYQCLQVVSKTKIEKQPQKKNGRYNLRSKGDPPTLEEMQENVRQLINKSDPLAASKQ